MTQPLLQTIDTDGIATITLNRPEVHNAFDAAQITALTETFAALGANPAVRLAVLQGAGPSFCSGGDVHWMRAMKGYSYDENLADSERLAAMFETIDRFPKPLIGKVHGLALGGGSGLAAVCDYVVAEAGTSFGFTESRIGLIPAVISPYVVGKIGYSHARHLFMSGARFSADRALEIGLIHDVAVDADELELKVVRAIREFLKAGPEAMTQAKALARHVHHYTGGTDALIRHTVEAIARIRTSPEAQEGMGALLEKRTPGWVKHDG